MLTYLAIGAVVAAIATFIAICMSNEDDRLLKAKQLSIWAAVFIVGTLAWPLVVFFGLCALFGA